MAFESNFALQPQVKLCLCPEGAFPKGNCLPGILSGWGQGKAGVGVVQHREGFTGFSGSRQDVSIPAPALPPGYSSCRTTQTGSSGSCNWFPAARDAWNQSNRCLQGMQELRTFSCSRITSLPEFFHPQQLLFLVLPALLVNCEHFQEQEASLSWHSMSTAETSSRPGTQIFS